MNKKSIIILVVLIPVIFLGIKISQLVYKYQEEKFKANIENQLKIMYDKDFVVKEESSTEGVRWTVGLSKWKKTSYICYRKDIPEIEFEVDLDKEGKKVEADNYQRKRIEYEAFQYYKPFFDVISDKYYIISKIYFLKKGASGPQDDILQEVDMPLYLELHKKTFKEIIKRYSDYIEIGFSGRIYTNKSTDEIENSIEKITYELAKTKICSIGFFLGVYELSIFKNYETEKTLGLNLHEDKKGYRGIVKEQEYLEQDNKKEAIKKIRGAWKWQ